MWKDIPNAPGYRVSDDGMVQCCLGRGGLRGKVTDRWRPLKGHPHPFGYTQYHLYIRGKAIWHMAHRLVLEAFVGPCPDGQVCRHEDGDPRNNKLSNLSWGTYTENEHDKRRHGTDPRGEKNPAAKLTIPEVLEIREFRESGKLLRELSAAYNVSVSTISDIALRKRFTEV